MAIINNINLDLEQFKFMLYDGNKFIRLITEKAIDRSVVAGVGDQLLIDLNKDVNKLRLKDTNNELIGIVSENSLNGTNSVVTGRLNFNTDKGIKKLLTTNIGVPEYMDMTTILDTIKNSCTFELDLNNYKVKVTRKSDNVVEYWDLFPVDPTLYKDTDCRYSIPFNVNIGNTGKEEDNYTLYAGIGINKDSKISYGGLSPSDGKYKAYDKLSRCIPLNRQIGLNINTYPYFDQKTKMNDLMVYAKDKWIKCSGLDIKIFTDYNDWNTNCKAKISVGFTGSEIGENTLAYYMHPYFGEESNNFNYDSSFAELKFSYKFWTDPKWGGTPKAIRQTAIHEIGHAVGLGHSKNGDGNAGVVPSKPSIMEYSSYEERLQDCIPCPNDRYGVEQWKNYWINKPQVQTLGLSEDVEEGLETYFVFPSYDNAGELMDSSGLIVEGNIISCESRVIDISDPNDKEHKVKYNVYKVNVINKLKGDCLNEIEIKIPFNEHQINYVDGDIFKFYLVEFNNIPYSPLNPEQGVEKVLQ